MPKIPIRCRRCRKKDLLQGLRLVLRTFNEVRRRTGKDPIRRRIRAVPGLFQHLLQVDPGSFYCTWRGDQLIGFGAAINRGRQWFLAWLFVHPRFQDRGIGQKLLRKVWRDGRGVVHSLVTMTYNMQAVGLYSRFGMVPEAVLTTMWVPMERLVQPSRTGLEVVEGVRRADLAWINALEKQIRGFPHAQEWRYWSRDDDCRILLFKRRGRRVGYSMISRRGDISPAGATTRARLSDVVAESLRLAGDHAARNGKQGGLMIICPHQNKGLYRLLLQAGFRHKEMLLFMSDAPYGDLKRYLPATPAVF